MNDSSIIKNQNNNLGILFYDICSTCDMIQCSLKIEFDQLGIYVIMSAANTNCEVGI